MAVGCVLSVKLIGGSDDLALGLRLSEIICRCFLQSERVRMKSGSFTNLLPDPTIQTL